MHFAVESCHPSDHGVIPLLLSHPELQINAENFAHQTALQLARGRHRLDLVDVLHEHGADWSESIGDYCSDTVSDEDMVNQTFTIVSLHVFQKKSFLKF